MRAFARSFFIAASVCCLFAPARARAQAAPPPPPPPAESPVTAVPEPQPSPVATPVTAGGPAEATTDHDLVVGHWGVEAREVGVFQRSPGNDLTCGNNCPLHINAFSVRRWATPVYAWSAGLALGLGGGSRSDAGTIKTWDTYFGIGPTVAADFLLTSWRHVSVGVSPQLDFLFFMPRGSGPKTFLVNARGLLEGEIHMGFIGLPELSVGLASGLLINFRGTTNAAATSNPGGVATQWDIGFSGPQSLWGLVTNMYLRFYF
jgi:hypothetical protein